MDGMRRFMVIEKDYGLFESGKIQGGDGGKLT